MATQMQLRGGTTAENLLFTGAQRELTVDTDKDTVRVHDGVTAGGFELASSADVDDGTFYYNEDAGSAADAYILVPKANTNVPSSYLDGIQFGFVTTHPNTGPSNANFQGLGVKNLKYPGGVDPLAGEISGRVYLIYDAANGWMEIQRKVAGPPPQLRSISASVNSNAMTITLAPCNIDFRSPSLQSGTVNSRVVTSAISLVIPSGATLGTTNGSPNRIAVIAIDNAGAVQLAAINLSGNANLDETALINTAAISGASSSASVFYSAAAATGVAYRVVGYVGSTQATAGTWATSPSNIQGQGGEVLIGVQRSLTGTAVPTTSGTSIDFTALPPGIRRITMMFDNVSLSGTSQFLIQLGTQAGVETTVYNSYGLRAGVTTIVAAQSTAGFYLPVNTANEAHSGQFILNRLTGNTWVGEGGVSSSIYVCNGAGGKTLAGELTRIRLTTANGTDTFDFGNLNIVYEV